ncbi:MAG: phosphoribosylformylglycinamidine cyclo-ligase [Chroococcidiopsidaceae cyanobacterium CP_BM_RX_35]|nr:phosphoribosylformylglycinamidine cyclo-ligase [Chroococcidiopsidaceae cyanobacterium CP_BM_RX_35]
MDYRAAGVDVEAGREFVGRIRHLVRSTYRPEVIGGLGGFNGCFQLPSGYREPILVSGTDGVGTKLKLAHALNCHHTIGIDLVAMCVNDVLTAGAEPLFFLDYLATGTLNQEQLVQVVAGISQACQLAGCALLGGETAEMPGFYQLDEYDLAGFCVGIVEKSQLLDGSQVQVGDVAIGLASTGVHSNGFSLVRKIVAERGWDWRDSLSKTLLHHALHVGGNHAKLSEVQSLGEAFLTPTGIYVKPVLAALQSGLEIHSMAHITGGGLPENLPRSLGDRQSIQINPEAWSIPPLFDWLAEAGSISRTDMFNTFNMGIGFVLLVPPAQAEPTIKWFESQDIAAYAIGEVIAGSGCLVGLPD